MARVRWLWILACAIALVTVTDAQAAGLAGTRAELASAMRGAGSGSGALVVDLGTQPGDAGAELFASRPEDPRVPASVEKLYTTATALLRLGPGSHLRTQVLGSAPVTGGRLDGDLYLRGAGDPTFGSTQMATLARTLVARTGLERMTGRVIGDETLFDRRRGPPSSLLRTSSYVGPLSALAFNRGRTGLRSPWFQTRPGLFATQAFERLLRREGVTIGARARTGRTPPAALALAAIDSPAVSDLVARTNRPSDNYFAETLIKVLGARPGVPGSTRSGAQAVTARMRQLGVTPHVVDGSGLSRTNRTSPRQVVGLLRAMALDPTAGPPFEASLAVAGRSGTLVSRMRGTPAAGNCRAKTGSLHAVSALAGYCTAADGTTRLAFAFLMNRVDLAGARRLQDRMAAALARFEP